MRLFWRFKKPERDAVDKPLRPKHTSPLPEEFGEAFRCYYQQVYMNGEDEEMFQRDVLAGYLR